MRAVFPGLPPKPCVDDVVENPEIAAEFGRGLPHHGDVLAEELTDHVDECIDGTAGTDDARRPARGAAMVDGVKQPPLVDSQSITEPHRLVQQPDLRGEQRVVDQLHALPGADCSHVKDGIAVAGEHGTGALDGVIGAADKQRHLPGGDVVRTAADRRVDHVDAMRPGLGRDALGRARASRGVDDQYRPRPHRRQQNAFQAHLLNLLVGEHADDDNVGGRPDVGQVGHRLRAEFAHCPPLLDRPAERADLVAGLDEAAHHGSAHAARPDEPDLTHRGYSIDFRAASAASNTAPSAADALAARLAAWRTSFCSSAPAIGASPSRVPPKTAMLPSALLTADPRVNTSHSLSRGIPRESPKLRVLIALPRLALNSRLFKILVIWPLPSGPRWTIGSA